MTAGSGDRTRGSEPSSGAESPLLEAVRLIEGDAAQVIPAAIEPGSVAMAYADPPFGNEQLWTGKAGSFDDRWEWSPASATGWAALRQHSPAGADLMAAIARDPKARAYLGVMAGMLLAVRGVLAKTGTLWLHFDDTMGAHLRVLGDVVFGPENQLGLVIWKRSTGHASKRGFARVHDTIACFARTRAARARLGRIRAPELVHGDVLGRIFVDGYVEDRLNSASSERVGYPTQKPTSLICRFIAAATLPGDMVLDPCCGSGSTIEAARSMNRRAIGIDISADAIAASSTRLFAPPAPQGDLFAVSA